MNCLRCNTENSGEAKFCKNCGMALTFTPAGNDDGLKQSMLFLLMILGWHYILLVTWNLLNLYIRKNYTGDSLKIMNIYKVVNWFDGGSTVLLILTFAILVKNNTTKIFLFIFLLIRIAMILLYALGN